MLHCKRFIFNPLEENTYVCYDEVEQQCVIIDPGCDSEREYHELYDFVSNNSLKVSLILETHLHFDHVWGAHDVAEYYGIQIAASQRDAFLLDEDELRKMGIMSMMNGTFKTPYIHRYLKEGEKIPVGKDALHVMEVPGHSPGSLAFYSEQTDMLFAGDLLFRCSVGRTDLPGGNYEQLQQSILSKIFRLPDNTVVWTGHGSRTTVGEEKQFNPYV